MVSVNTCFVSESPIILQSFPVVSQVVTKRKVSSLISDYVQNCRCDTLLPVGEKERLRTSNEDYVLLARFAENISFR
jgi:hypothetical protein